MKRWIGSFGIVLWGTVSACSFEPAVSGSMRCIDDADCRTGRVCVSGRCTNPSTLAPDAGGSGDASMDEEGCSVDRDGDGFKFGPACAPEELDCNDSDAGVFPGAEPSCNGRDNDCDGEIDEADCECTTGQVGECGFTVGQCETGTRTCVDGRWGMCRGATAGTEESCNGLDDDCDGTVDEGCPCQSGESQDCGSDVGACQPGVQRCVDGAWGECEGETGPSAELCNGEDDDCDGVVDDAPQDVGAPCTAAADGVCAGGQQACSGGQLECVPGTGSAEQCNGLDDDCDGLTDEDVTQACTSACGAGVQACDAGLWGVCVPDAPPEEECNGQDDDCDGATDESFPEDGTACDTGLPGVCAAGAFACSAAALDCVPTTAATAEVCDGVDNDCDGLVDEDVDGTVLAEACGNACPSRSVRVCEGGAWGACERTDIELCNTIDDNCDSVADNSGACLMRCPGGGSALGTVTCGVGCELPAEICGDGIDNDCDGVIDQPCDDDFDDMVYVHGGTFRMGAPNGSPAAQADEQPIHTVELEPFYIDKFEVSRAQYGDCVLSGDCSTLEFGCPLQLTERDSPITCVSWSQARDYCSWAGKRLPTEAEWEKAARGPFPREVLFPWGDAVDGSRAAMNCGGSLNQCTVSVDSGSSGASYYGVRHMAGNAAEWVQDYYLDTFYTAAFTVQPFQATNFGVGRVLRGGGWNQGLEFGRVANRAVADFLLDTERGFRCAK